MFKQNNGARKEERTPPYDNNEQADVALQLKETTKEGKKDHELPSNISDSIESPDAESEPMVRDWCVRT